MTKEPKSEVLESKSKISEIVEDKQNQKIQENEANNFQIPIIRKKRRIESKLSTFEKENIVPEFHFEKESKCNISTSESNETTFSTSSSSKSSFKESNITKSNEKNQEISSKNKKISAKATIRFGKRKTSSLCLNDSFESSNIPQSKTPWNRF